MMSASKTDGKHSGEIKKLSESVTSLIRASITINSFATCVTELVCNSIDAGATCIAVRIDFSSYKIQVIDNGHGIDKKNLQLLGERYMTSKCHSLHDLKNCLDKFGFRGEALASITETSRRVEITSRALASGSTYRKIFEQDEASSIETSDEQRPTSGTTVTVFDFLYNTPVRRKKVHEHFDSEEMRVQMEHLALVHPHISFSLKNEVTGKVLMDCRRCSSMKEICGQIFGPVLADHLHEVEFSNGGKLSVNGLISLSSHHTRAFQFIYVNRRLVLRTPMHKLMINWLSSVLKSDKRQRHPIFMLNLSCPYSTYDITFDPSKTLIQFDDWEPIERTFEGVLKQFALQQRIELPVELFKRKEQKSGKAHADLSSKVFDPHLKLKRVTKGAVSRRLVSAKEIVEEVLLIPQYEEASSSADRIGKIWESAMPQRFEKVNPSTKFRQKIPSPPSSGFRSSKSSASPEEVALKVQQPLFTAPQLLHESQSWSYDRARECIFEQFAEIVQQALRAFVKKMCEELISQPSEPSISQPEGTDLTQGLQTISVVAEEPPEQIFERHNDFLFNPVMQEEVKKVDCEVVYETEDEEAYYEAEPQESLHEVPCSKLVNEVCHLDPDYYFQRPSSVNHDVFTVEADVHFNPYLIEKSPEVIKKVECHKLPDLQILQHLSPNSKEYQDLVAIFNSKETKSPVRENHHWLQKYPLTQIDEKENRCTSPAYSLNSPASHELMDMDCDAENQNPLTFPAPVIDCSNALALFEDPEDSCEPIYEEMEDTQSSMKRRTLSPIISMEPKKAKVDSEWQTMVNGDGQQFFVSRNGHVIVDSPKDEECFFIQERHPFMPRGTSPILKLAPHCDLKLASEKQQQFLTKLDENLCEVEEAAAVAKWVSLQEWNEEKERLKNLIQLHIIDAGARPMPDLAPNDLFNDGNFSKLRSSFDQYDFQPGSLLSSKIIGQMDKKFVVALMNKSKENNLNMVVLIDQHAAHERVRLEMLTKDYQADGNFLSSPLHPPMNLSLSKSETLTVQEFQCTFRKYGLECEAMGETEVRIFSIPLCFSKKHEKQNLSGWLLNDAIERLVKELAQSLIETRGVCMTIPQEMREVLNSEACSGAIKFNMLLSRNASRDLVTELAQCQLPFQCAHGRNSIFPVFNLDKLNRQKRPNPQINSFLRKLKR